MASQALNQLEAESQPPFMLRDILPGPGWAPYRAPARMFPRALDRAPHDSVEEGNCIKGFLAGIAIEGIVALSVYAVWQAWHLLR